MTMKLRIFGILTSSLALCSVAFAAPQTDFDIDGTSDLLFQSTSGSSFLWGSVPSGSGTALSETFGLSTDLVAPASWLSEGLSSLGVVRTSQTTGQLTWRVLRDNALIESRTFGKAGAAIVSGADFDGDGVADAAVVTLVNGRLKWRVRLGMFTDSPTTWTFFFG